MAKTISEIAEATGYSRTTITMVLSGRASQYRISARAQKIIQAYVDEHGVTINQTARNLKTKRSQTVGFIVPDIANAFFAHVTAHLEGLCRAEGLVLVTTSSLEDPETEKRAIDSLLARGVDGLVLAPCAPRPPEPSRKRGRNTPLILIDRAYPEDQAPVISSNHQVSAHLVTREMIAAGASRIAFLCGHPDNPSIQDRIEGFRKAVVEAGLSDEDVQLLSAPEDSAEAGHAMMGQLMSAAGKAPPAILCSSLLVLEGALKRMKGELGAVPRDVIIGTFDYDGLLEFLPNKVFVVQQDEEAMARAVFDLLLQQMSGQKAIKPGRTILETQLVHLG